MTFSTDQIAKLDAPLDRKHVAQRSQAGRQLSYIEGWHALSEANRVFGFDGWSSETVEMKCVADGERQSNQGRKLFTCTYTARCRVTVHAGSRVIVREGVGAGHGMDQDAGQAHEKAVKEAETDSRKRALMTFGNIFGLALYDKSQANVSDETETGVAQRQSAGPSTPPNGHSGATEVGGSTPPSRSTQSQLKEPPRTERAAPPPAQSTRARPDPKAEALKRQEAAAKAAEEGVESELAKARRFLDRLKSGEDAVKVEADFKPWIQVQLHCRRSRTPEQISRVTKAERILKDAIKFKLEPPPAETVDPETGELVEAA